MRWHHGPLLILCMSLTGAWAAESTGDETAAEDASVAEAGDAVLDADGDTPRLSYPSYDQRRDVFLSMVEVRRAERELEDIRNEGDDLVDVPDAATTAPQADADPSDAVAWAEEAVEEVDAHLRNESWEQAMEVAQRHLERVRSFRQRFPDDPDLSRAENLLGQHYAVARDRKLYEEARAQFQALGLRIEGIIWSADEPSLAIISGEPRARAVDDRVRGTVITAIGQNRVDFLYTHRKRRYDFQLYLEPNN